VHNAYARHDFTASSAEAVTWSMVEANVGIICASMLALKPLIIYFFPQATKDRQPPRWSLTLNTVATSEASEPDIEKGPTEQQRDSLATRSMSLSSADRLGKITEELEGSDELTLVDTRQSYIKPDMRRERTRSWSEQTILDMEGAITGAVPAPTSPLTAHMAEEEENEQMSALATRRQSNGGRDDE
jgi:hypothetical protein